MKAVFGAVKKLLKEYPFCIFAAIAMLMPDLQLRYLVWPKVFIEAFVEPVAWLFSFAWVFLIVFVCAVILPKNTGRIVYIVLCATAIVLSFAQYVYFKIFEQFFWIKSAVLLGEGADYMACIVDYIDPRLVLCTGIALACLIIASIKWKRPQTKHKAWWLVVLVPILMLVGLNTFMKPELFGDSQDDWDSWRKPRVVYKQFSDTNKSYDVSGFYQFSLRDLFRTVFPQNKISDEDFAKVEEYFASKQVSQNEYTGIFEGKNIIAVMLESIDSWMIDEKYTPTMCYMMRNGINFTNYYAPTFGTGHTLNSEFAFNTGYFNPITSVSSVNFVSNEFPYSMANLFKNKGYTTNSFHYNDPGFYNRGILHKSLGFEKYNSFSDFGLPETVAQVDSNVLSNDEIYKKMTQSQPFFDFVITYSGHVPYTVDDAKLSLAKQNHPELIDPNMNNEKNNCMILAADTDDFFKQLLQRLEDDGILENTVIVAFADHYAYGFSDQNLLAEYKKGKNLYQVPAFIYTPGISAQKVSKPMMTVDFLPTLANLFGLDYNNCYIGNDIFDSNNNGFVYFGSSTWVDDKMYYEPSDKEPAENQKVHIDEQNKRMTRSFEINDIVISGDYFAKK